MADRTRMVAIQLVTVEGCPGAPCRTCMLADETLHRVLAILGVPLPDHEGAGGGEHYLADGRVVEAVHLDCGDEAARGLDPAKAPFLLIDGLMVLENAGADTDALAQAVITALRPHGLADLRP